MKLHKSAFAKRVFIFIIAALLIALFYPSKVRFKYNYALDQPWRYEGVLTAPYNFKVYKSAAERAAERDSIERTKVRYYTLVSHVRIQEKNQLTTDFSEHKFPDKITSKHIRYILNMFDEVYDRGIISSDNLDLFGESAVTACYIVDEDNVAKKREVSEIFSYKSAYEHIVNNAPEDIPEEDLKLIGLEKYLQPNLEHDAKKTEQMQEARLATLSDVIREVQKGERIVGTGDLVTPEIYQELEGYKKAYEGAADSSTKINMLFLGHFLLIFGCELFLLFYLISYRSSIIGNIKHVVFLLGLVVFFVVLTYILVPTEPVITYMIPFCIVPMLIRLFFDPRTAITTHIVTILLSSLVVPSPMEFILIQIVTGGLLISTLSVLSQRSDLIKTSFVAYFSMVALSLVYSLGMEGTLATFDWALLFYYAINFIFLMFTYVLVYAFERLFGYVSSISLVELSDINKPLLRQMSEVAPGTFQHSLNVSILASEAVDRIGGDVRLVRSGALYHDIGKMKNPNYFTENQGVNNPHDRLSYEESAKMIIRHVTDGVEMAEKEKLPQVLIDFIRTHHGLGMTKYFYIQYKNENPDMIIDESVFHYPGPNPFTREQGVLMLADAVEASSRSLKELTEPLIAAHINKIVDGIVNDGLLKNAPLTLRDIEVIKQVFNDKLKTMYHSRIEYPELKRDTI